MERIPNEILAHIFKWAAMGYDLAPIAAIRATCRPFKAIMDSILAGSNGILANLINDRGGLPEGPLYGAVIIMGEYCFKVIDISGHNTFIYLFKPRWGLWRPMMAKALLNGLGEARLIEDLDLEPSKEDVGFALSDKCLKLAELAHHICPRLPKYITYSWSNNK
jgi:hypothetical protein